jgi:PII-like signaling protein
VARRWEKIVHGYQVTLYTVESRRHHGKQLSHWLLEVMREMKIRGVTHLVAAEGIGHDHRFHSWHFVELADRPEAITMIATESEVQALFDRLATEDVHVFYAKSPVEFGFLGKAAPGSDEASG